jgi:hypothetical protein
VLRDPRLSLGAKALYALLKSYAWQDSTTHPGVKRMCRDAGCSDRTLKKFMDELVDAGLIEVKRRGQGKTNLYIFKALTTSSDPNPFTKQESERGSVLESERGSNNEDSVYEDSVNNSPKGAGAPGAKDLLSILVDRCREVDFEPTPGQKAGWGKELAGLLASGRDLAEIYGLISKIQLAAANGYCWSFKRADKGRGERSPSVPPERPHPQSDAALAARDKPRRAEWYVAAYGAQISEVESLIASGLDHPGIVERLREGG